MMGTIVVDTQPGILFESEDVRRIERTLLKDNTADLLRDYIISGRVEPGAKLVERQISAALGISRMPIRDAMIKLEQLGLVVSRPTGRFVVEVSQHDALQLNRVRAPLEMLAVDLASQTIEPREATRLQDALAAMARAGDGLDRAGFVQADVAIHAQIWEAAKNRYLQQTLTTIQGPLLVLIANGAEAFDWAETLAIHAEIVAAILAGDRQRAAAAMSRHMESIMQ